MSELQNSMIWMQKHKYYLKQEALLIGKLNNRNVTSYEDIKKMYYPLKNNSQELKSIKVQREKEIEEGQRKSVEKVKLKLDNLIFKFHRQKRVKQKPQQQNKLKLKNVVNQKVMNQTKYLNLIKDDQLKYVSDKTKYKDDQLNPNNFEYVNRKYQQRKNQHLKEQNKMNRQKNSEDFKNYYIMQKVIKKDQDNLQDLQDLYSNSVSSIKQFNNKFIKIQPNNDNFFKQLEKFNQQNKKNTRILKEESKSTFQIVKKQFESIQKIQLI